MNKIFKKVMFSPGALATRVFLRNPLGPWHGYYFDFLYIT